ncbi:hypothetical protein [Hymenobacter properus]|uniref:Outer membrane protein beta-barrel domain-containing protein n=1 Tax=Hymenobacter properus TaxID=2791026 RepID=A0A931BGQ8_9BACT|nr:hypothetical protein [Hymenobacter properus]MBF9141326.1 hypothetical protein [Hymenobacter properus]MBR7720136.1 hypothetical protein [Microvirga sp. SRT04]
MLSSFSRYFGLLAAAASLTTAAQAQERPVRPAAPASRSTTAPEAPAPTTPTRYAPVPEAPSDEQSYRKEFVYGINFNTQGGLIGGVSVRSTRVLDNRLLRFWSLEGVMLKNAKEERINTAVGGSYIDRKTNYAFVLRPSFGMQRILFRKAADAGVQVNGLLSAGPSLGLLMPYYISYDRTFARTQVPSLATDEIVNEQYDPLKHTFLPAILDHGPLFSGISDTKVVPGFHVRGGLSFEYGRYRDAVTGLEVGVLVEAFTKRMVILSPYTGPENQAVNRQFFPSVYLTLYFGHRS